MVNKKYSDEVKLQAVERYLAGEGCMKLVREYGISDKGLLREWVKKYQRYGHLTDHRKSWYRNSPDRSKMSDEEYIRYLEMENDILKQLRSLNNSRKK